jgi:hypothetical protein
MKIIITESQMNGLWIKRRHDVVEKSYNDTVELFDGVDICNRYDGLDEFIDMFFWWFFRMLEDIYYYEEGKLPDNLMETLMKYYKPRVLEIYDESCS